MRIEGQPAATVDSVAENSPKHLPVPPGTSFVTTPSNRGTVSSGSGSVRIHGKAAARVGDPVRTCNDPVDRDGAKITTGAIEGVDRMTDFLGRGVAFPFLPDAGGTLRYVEGDPEVAQSLRLLLMTAAGERVMRSQFGTEAPRLVFAPGSETNKNLLEESIRDAVRDYEPRVRARRRGGERVSRWRRSTWTSRSPTRCGGPTPATASSFPYYLSRPGGLP